MPKTLYRINIEEECKNMYKLHTDISLNIDMKDIDLTSEINRVIKEQSISFE